MSQFDELINRLRTLQTEAVNPNSTDIDLLSAEQIATKINNEDATVASVVKKAIPIIAKTAEQFAATIRAGGRIFYVGAGTSGRLGVLDAAECPPTFGSDPDQIIGLISGGYETLILSAEGVEDDCEAAVADLKKQSFSKSDFLIGIAASSRTPYTLAAIKEAHESGAPTAFITCNSVDQLEIKPDFLIELPVGPEVITGSTRMKSGTAQKMTLNMISTTAMVLLGKTYGNLMVDLQAKSAKLEARSRKILIDMFDIDLAAADLLLKQAGGSVKLAIVMKLTNCDRPTAIERLDQAGGFIRNLECK
jgi:N-acetylmuramic acid 6-phosphate etherase